MMDRHIKAPLNDDEVKMLKAGDYVYISGTIYTARDAAHKRMYEALQNGQEVPMPLKNNIVYYMDRHRPEKDVRLVRPDRQPAAEWISMHHFSWTRD